ncbi:MAG TPA: hypothetical protein VGD65_17620 [Chryseosolibacter sp.]
MRVLSKVLFFAILGELILGGGGRLVAIGPVSLRMILFALAMVFTAMETFRGRRMPRQLTIFLLLFIASLALASAIGFMSGASLTFLIEDVKPLLYVLILPFFYFVTSEMKITQTIPAIIISGAFLMSLVFLAILVLIHSGVLPFLDFYDLVVPTGEFFFRAETTFFYKGFIYLCIALVFVSLSDFKYRIPILFVLSISIVLTFTRGFVFALAMTWMFYSLLERRYVHLVAGVIALVLIGLFAKPAIYQLSTVLHTLKGYDEHIVPKDRLLGNREASDSGRAEQFRQVVARVTPISFAVGHGFGHGVPSRPLHMEISYLEILHKQGVVGLGIWAYLFYLIYVRFYSCGQSREAKGYFYGVCLLFFQSITNQFINNPIGLGFAILSLVWLEHASAIPNHQSAPRHQKGDELSVTNF